MEFDSRAARAPQFHNPKPTNMPNTSRGNFHFHYFQGSFFLDNHQTRPRLARKQTSQARSAQRCRMRSFSLHFVKQARDSTRQGALRKLVGASCSAQVAPRKLLRQVGPCKLLCANCAPCKLLCASCSVQVALCKLLCVSCSAQVALGKALCANWSVQVALRKLLCATCSAQVAVKCKLHLATPARGPGRNRTRDPPVPGAGARTTRQLPRNKSRKKP